MLPPPSPRSQPEARSSSPAGQAGGPETQRAGLAVLLVALIALLGLVALVWWVNERDADDDSWRSRTRPTAVAGSPT